MVDGKKICGNAQDYYKNNMLHHGTILYDANHSFVASVLNVKQDKIQSKGIKSDRARVTNIKPLGNSGIDINIFKLILLESLLRNNDIVKSVYYLNSHDLERIRIL